MRAYFLMQSAFGREKIKNLCVSAPLRLCVKKSPLTPYTRMLPNLKHTLKSIRYRLRRAQAARRWGVDRLAAMPAVLGNAMPKSGSHLLFQVLAGLVELGPFVDPGYPPVNRGEDNRKLADAAVLHAVNDMQPGEIR
jgi:hypothetical protein